MKTLVALFAFVALTAVSFATTPYNVANYQTSGTITVSGLVNEVDLTITPSLQTIELTDGINPGEVATLNPATNDVVFNLSGAQGYNVSWTATVDYEDNMTFIKCAASIDGGLTWTAIPGSGSYNGTLTIPPTTLDGAPVTATVNVGVTEFKALPGAPAGARNFSLTCAAEYFEL